MKKLDNKKLANITGGEVSVWVYMISSAIVVFVSGIIKGYTHPRSCNG